MNTFRCLIVFFGIIFSSTVYASPKDQSDTLSLLCKKWYISKVIVMDSLVNISVFDTISYPLADTTFLEFLQDGTLIIIDSKKNRISTEWSFDTHPGIIDLISNNNVYDNFKIVTLKPDELRYICYTYSEIDRKYRKGLFKLRPI